MTYGTRNSFLDDLEEETTLLLIAEGNLRREKAKPAFTPVWTHIGYVAQLQRLFCACGYSYDHFLGAFSREKSPSNETRDTALPRGFQIPLGHAYPVEISHFKTPACPACLSAKGFADFPPA